jgi:hypothetical protein
MGMALKSHRSIQLACTNAVGNDGEIIKPLFGKISKTSDEEEDVFIHHAVLNKKICSNQKP